MNQTLTPIRGTGPALIWTKALDTLAAQIERHSRSWPRESRARDRHLDALDALRLRFLTEFAGLNGLTVSKHGWNLGKLDHRLLRHRDEPMWAAPDTLDHPRCFNRETHPFGVMVALYAADIRLDKIPATLPIYRLPSSFYGFGTKAFLLLCQPGPLPTGRRGPTPQPKLTRESFLAMRAAARAQSEATREGE